MFLVLLRDSWCLVCVRAGGVPRVAHRININVKNDNNVFAGEGYIIIVGRRISMFIIKYRFPSRKLDAGYNPKWFIWPESFI